MKVLVTGADGFLGKNLCVRLAEIEVEVVPLTRRSSGEEMARAVESVDFVFHLAGVNRPNDPAEFIEGNSALTERLADLIARSARKLPVVFSSSIQAELQVPYGLSKLAAEQALLRLSETTGAPVYIYRLPNVFGKWCKPNYNSVVATFCHNVARGLPTQVHDPSTQLNLVYVDDVVDDFLVAMKQLPPSGMRSVEPVYSITLGELAEEIRSFPDGRQSLMVGRVGKGLSRALYATYISYLEGPAFAYTVPKHEDPRGMFVEMLKTPDTGQFSFFTAHPGVTRGGHYHHTKTEKFLVVRGRARFRYRHIITDEIFVLETTGEAPTIVETIPGWAHDITNIGDEEMVVMLWANEIFDRQRPDTVASECEN